MKSSPSDIYGSHAQTLGVYTRNGGENEHAYSVISGMV
jgi:hypothetical protein